MLDGRSRTLVTFGKSPVRSTTVEEQTFDVESIMTGATLTVRTTYTGAEADDIRSRFASGTRSEKQKSY